MLSYIKFLSFALVALIASYIGWTTYQYYTIQSTPTIDVVGLIPEGTYAGYLSFSVKAHDDYKVGTLTIRFDDKSVVKGAKIGKKSVDYPVKIDTQDLGDGPHTLFIEAENAAYNKKSTTQTVPLYVDNSPLHASLTKNETDARISQGRTLHVKFETNKEIKEATLKTLSKTYPCFAESQRGHIYECYVPIDCEEVPNEYPYTVDVIDKVGNTLVLNGKFHVVSFPFKKQTVRLNQEKMKAENEAGLPEKQLEAEIEELTKKSPRQKLWSGGFITPVEITDAKQITSEFGAIRAMQERGLKQHKAVDIFATPKTVVWAPADGIVVLKNRYAHSGNTVIIDHGYGILSLFFHLDTFGPIEVGEKIKKGNPIGTLGKTGYATGYHLHWELRVGNTCVEPLEWTKPGF